MMLADFRLRGVIRREPGENLQGNEQIVRGLLEVGIGQLIQRLTEKTDRLTHMAKPRLAPRSYG